MGTALQYVSNGTLSMTCKFQSQVASLLVMQYIELAAYAVLFTDTSVITTAAYISKADVYLYIDLILPHQE